MSIPVIFTHSNNSLYLQLALLQAKKAGAGGHEVCLIGDKSNDAAFINHYNLSDYDKSDLCLELEKHYKHFSPNPYNYELFCYKRWFVALEFLHKNKFSECFCVDSDVLIYDDLNKLSGLLEGKDFSVIRFTGEFAGPQCCYFKLEALKEFCLYILKMYRDDFASLQKIYDGFKQKGYACGLSDMVLFAEFCKKNKNRFVDFDYSPERDFCFDENFGLSYGFECGKKGKVAAIRGGVPFVKRLDTGAEIKFFMFHFQGDNKPYMGKHCVLSFSERLESPYYLKLWIKTSMKNFCKRLLSLAPESFQRAVKDSLKKRKAEK